MTEFHHGFFDDVVTKDTHGKCHWITQKRRLHMKEQRPIRYGNSIAETKKHHLPKIEAIRNASDETQRRPFQHLSNYVGRMEQRTDDHQRIGTEGSEIEKPGERRQFIRSEPENDCQAQGDIWMKPGLAPGA